MRIRGNHYTAIADTYAYPPCEFREEFPLMTSIGDMPDVPWNVMPLCPCHIEENSPFCPRITNYRPDSGGINCNLPCHIQYFPRPDPFQTFQPPPRFTKFKIVSQNIVEFSRRVKINWSHNPADSSQIKPPGAGLPQPASHPYSTSSTWEARAFLLSTDLPPVLFPQR